MIATTNNETSEPTGKTSSNAQDSRHRRNAIFVGIAGVAVAGAALFGVMMVGHGHATVTPTSSITAPASTPSVYPAVPVTPSGTISPAVPVTPTVTPAVPVTPTVTPAVPVTPTSTISPATPVLP
ncbi:hypothetical protein ABLE92_02670 [Gordonia sp. VNQ95]